MHATILALALLLSPQRIVFCAPGYPGSTQEAQAAMDAFADAAAPGGGLAAVYHEREDEGLAAIRDDGTSLALVPWTFFVEHGKELGLTPRLSVVKERGSATERWTLVAKKGRVKAPADLAGWEIAGLAAYSPAFVRGPAFAAWGKIPEQARLRATGQILTSLRKAAAGQDVAVLLDAAQAASLPTLPFAADLETVATSKPVPAAVLCTTPRGSGPETAKLLKGIEGVGKEALSGLRIEGFAPAPKPD